MALDTGIGAGDVWPERPVNSLDGSVDTFAAAETQPGGPGAPPFHAAITCYGGSRSAQRPLWNRYPGESRFISGRASRVALLEGLVLYLRRQSGVCFTTCEEVAWWHDKQRA